jgi:hypothetical protein
MYTIRRKKVSSHTQNLDIKKKKRKDMNEKEGLLREKQRVKGVSNVIQVDCMHIRKDIMNHIFKICKKGRG